MPSHIYSMVGLWEESIASNRSALQVQKDYYHATDFMVYAHLQLAQDAKAKALIDEIDKIGRDDLLLKENLPNLGSYTALAVIPARYPLERGDWKGAAALPAVPTKRLMADSLIRFTRGLGMARSGDVAGAKREIEAIQGLQKALLKAKDSYWAARSEEQVLAVSAWVAHAEGAREQAVKLMRSAADGEDGSVKHVAMENRLYPMRELFAELLLESGQAAPALREFEAAFKENPNRYRGLYGAARAAEAAGDRQKAESLLHQVCGGQRKRRHRSSRDRSGQDVFGEEVRRFWIFDGSTLLTTGFGFWIEEKIDEASSGLCECVSEIRISKCQFRNFTMGDALCALRSGRGEAGEKVPRIGYVRSTFTSTQKKYFDRCCEISAVLKARTSMSSIITLRGNRTGH